MRSPIIVDVAHYIALAEMLWGIDDYPGPRNPVDGFTYFNGSKTEYIDEDIVFVGTGDIYAVPYWPTLRGQRELLL